MARDSEQPLDPTKIAAREFSSSFRGYDSDEVREFLRTLADQIRAERTSRPVDDRNAERVAELLRERDELKGRVEELDARVGSLEADVAAAVERAEAAEQASDPTTWDESRIDALVGAETAHVLEAARTAAAGIRTRAEADADARLKVAEERQRSTEAEIAERRRTTDAELAALTAEAESTAERLRTESEATAAALIADAEAAAAAERAAAAAEAEQVRSEAAAASEAMRAAAVADAEAARAEADDDVAAARDRSREESRLMLVEAQGVREKVLADLVVRRRAGRTQLDQIKAARDRMARSLALVRRELDEAIDELANAVPEAKAAMEEVGRSAQSIPDAQAVLELASQLDRERVRAVTADADDDHDGDPELETLDGGESDAAETAPAVDEADETSELEDEDDATFDADASEVALDEVDDEDDAGDDDDDEVALDEVALDDDDDDEESEPVVESRVDRSTSKLESLLISAGSGAEPIDVDVDDHVDDYAADVPDIFRARDVAMTRFGPDLRRQLKRALADDQSDVLDRVRRAKRQVVLADLPPVERQVLTYIDAVSDSVQGAARAGATAAGGTVSDESVTAIVDTLARAIALPLRQRVERSITGADGNPDEVLEPLRAHYRDARTNDLPSLADDALAEAFAMGAYDALPKGKRVVWVADPRHEPGPDCYDNTLSGAVKKPAPFPTGRRAPLGGPGCRCLVVAEGSIAR